MTPPSVSTSSVTIGRVPLGFSAAPASGSSAGSATICERIPDIFITTPWAGRSARRTIAPLALREKRVRNGALGGTRPKFQGAVSGNVEKVLVSGQHCQFMAEAELREQRIDRA